jgi:hypothetical protein
MDNFQHQYNKSDINSYSSKQFQAKDHEISTLFSQSFGVIELAA